VWLLVFAVACIGAVVTYMRCPGCIPRDRVNASCQWTDDTFPLDARTPSHQDHLVEDAQLAEELAIRYADAEFGRRFGVEHHGGLIDDGRFRNECLSRLFRAIENDHDVTAEQVRVARGERNGMFDLAVVLLFLPIYSLGATVACRRLFDRFSSSERSVAVIAAGLASIPAALLGLQILRLWGAVWEVVRVGNGHMSSLRAASYSRWTYQYPGADFIGGLMLFWLIALFYYHAARDGERPEPRRPGLNLAEP
jgi:hypothetical protein